MVTEMNSGSDPDVAVFCNVHQLIVEGWRCHGSEFQGGRDQNFLIRLTKKGKAPKKFTTLQPYPPMIFPSAKRAKPK